MLLIIGLGNPGLAYRKTYHNIGFRCVDKLADRLGVKFKHKYCSAKVAEYFYKSEKIIIAKPQTYMNCSGESVALLISRFNAKSNEVLIVYDDIDLPFGSVRMRKEGGPGTHNGMRSIVNEIGKDVPRIRAGIGRENEDTPLFSYVLSNIPKDKKLQEDKLTDKIANALLMYIEDRNIEKVGKDFNETIE